VTVVRTIEHWIDGKPTAGLSGATAPAIALVTANPYGNGTAVFTSSGAAARRFTRGVHVGMVGVNVPIPVPMAYYSFDGWKDSLFGQSRVHGPNGVEFYTRSKVVTERGRHRGACPWPATTSRRRPSGREVS
jgi:hypothetical protein